MVAVTQSLSLRRQKQRIHAAIGNGGDDLPMVDEETLVRYYEYLSENLSFPFHADYPELPILFEEPNYECTVQAILDPSTHVSDPFDGILCKTRKAGVELYLPLHELELAQHDPNFELVEDYWYWFWKWR